MIPKKMLSLRKSEIIQLSTEGMTSVFDSDCLDADGSQGAVITDVPLYIVQEHGPVLQTLPVVNEESGAPLPRKDWEDAIPLEELDYEPVNQQQSPEREVTFVLEEPQPSCSYTQNSCTSGNSWQSYSQAMLKKPLHPALASAIKNTKSCNGDESHPLFDKPSSVAEETITAPKMPGKKPPTTSHSWLNRRRPTFTRTSTFMSGNSKRRGSWVDARKQVALLQVELLEEHNARERREEALYQKKEIMYDLKIKNLELDIKIKEKALRECH